ncbi:MAG: hypothetical protein K5930_08655 [Treponemataceae bacterium]|nr:hypothetical protein [Treponemataceae bacterium]
MKKSLWLVLVFFVFFIILVSMVSFFSMLAENCMHMKVGDKIAFFNISFFINCCIRYLPWCAVISLIVLILYIIKHKFSIPQFIIPYFILSLSIWLLGVPGVSYLYENIQKSDPIPIPDDENLSVGYFRPDGEYLTYVTGTSDAAGEIWRRKVFLGRKDNSDDGKYADVLIESVVRAPDWATLVHEKCLILKQTCSRSLEKGYLSYLLFATMGFAVSFIIFLCRFSSWRLVNVLTVLISFFIILFANICFYDQSIVEKIPFLEKWWIPLAFNVTLCVLFGTVGIINWVRHPERNRRGK